MDYKGSSARLMESPSAFICFHPGNRPSPASRAAEDKSEREEGRHLPLLKKGALSFEQDGFSASKMYSQMLTSILRWNLGFFTTQLAPS